MNYVYKEKEVRLYWTRYRRYPRHSMHDICALPRFYLTLQQNAQSL